jgi:hypothetical protein
MMIETKREMQMISVAQGWRCINSGIMTFEDVAANPPKGITPARWVGMLKHRKEAEADE